MLIFVLTIKDTNASNYNSLTPNDLYYKNQWYLPRINSESAWGREIKKKDVTIAIIDSGVQIDHPDLKDNIWVNENEIAGNNIDDDRNEYTDDVNGWDFLNDTNNPNPKFAPDMIPEEISHGTIIAGIAAAKGNNIEGVAGLAWDAKIMPLLVLDAKGAGDVRGVIRAIDYAVSNKADIINLSFVGEGYNADLESAIRRAYKAGVLVVAAAGNNDETNQGRDLNKNPLYPVCYDGYYGENMVIGVAATDALDQKTVFSGYGKCVDISAPGVSMFSTNLYAPRLLKGENVLNKYYEGYWSGTSMATPLVSAAAALVIANNPSLDRKGVVDILLGSSDYLEKLNPLYQGKLGSGRLNVGRAVDMAIGELNTKSTKIINSPFSSGVGKIDITDLNGGKIKELNVLNNFKGGINVASGYLDKSKKKYTVIGAGTGGGPQVQVYANDGKLISQFFAYNKNFRGGVNIAVGDVNNDGLDEIVTGAGSGGGPHVKIFNSRGELLGQFFAFDPSFGGGVNVAVGDVNGDSIGDIICGAGPGGGPQVRYFSKNGDILGQFFAYDINFRGGVNVATADFDGGLRKYKEIVTSPASIGSSHVRIFDNFGKLKSEFIAYGPKYRGRTNIATGDINNDGLDEVLTGAGMGGTSHVRIFDVRGTLLYSYLAFEQSFMGGVNLSITN